jgi:hypothetical protein
MNIKSQMWLDRFFFLLTLVFIVLIPNRLLSQQFTRTEIGMAASVLAGNRSSSVTDAGLGSRFTYNLSSSFSIDSEFDTYFTNINVGQRSLQDGGRAILGLIGPKAGLRRPTYGIFFKARPGFISFANALSSSSLFGALATKRITHVALDLGLASEFYPSTRTILRLDVGALLVRYGDATLFSAPIPNGVFSIRSSGSVNSPWHIAVGAGYRLGTLHEQNESPASAQRFQVGVQYSLFTLERSAGTVRDESGVGGWTNWNFSKYFGLDSGVSFFPRQVRFADFQQGGRILQALVGLRSGIRRQRFGVFGKFRPGLQLYTATEQNQTGASLTHFADAALDLGGIIEIYTSRRTLLRFDAGNTFVHYRGRDVVARDGTPVHIPAFTKSTIQLTSGFGFRF